MSMGLRCAAALAGVLLAGATTASAQSYYGYDQLPPAPYQVEGGGAYGGYGGGDCGGGRFPLLGAHAGVTVLGVDLGAGAALSVPTGGYCNGPAVSYAPRPYAPPAPPEYAPQAYAPPAYEQPAYGYAPPPSYGYQGYGYQGYGEQAYAPPMPAAYPPPCGCAAAGW